MPIETIIAIYFIFIFIIWNRIIFTETQYKCTTEQSNITNFVSVTSAVEIRLLLVPSFWPNTNVWSNHTWPNTDSHSAVEGNFFLKWPIFNFSFFVSPSPSTSSSCQKLLVSPKSKIQQKTDHCFLSMWDH